MSKWQKNLWLYLLLLVIFLFCVFPFLWLVSTSLKSAGNVFKLESFADLLPQGFTIENYRAVFQQIPDLVRYFWSSFIICFWAILISVTISALAGYPLAKMDFYGKNFTGLLLLSTMLLPLQSGMVVNFITIRHLGLFDTYTAVILPGAVSVFGIFLMPQAFLVIPQDLIDAVRIDGGGELDLWWRVLLPLTKPQLAALTIFSFVAYWNFFLWPLIVLKSESKYPLTVGLSYLANMFSSDFRLVAAASVLSMIPVIIIFLFTQRFFIKGMEGIGKV